MLIWAVSICWAVVGSVLCSDLVRGKPCYPLAILLVIAPRSSICPVVPRAICPYGAVKALTWQLTDFDAVADVLEEAIEGIK